MKTPLLLARQMRLALLVTSALANAHMHANYSASNPGASGLTRLERDLCRAPIGTADKSNIRNKVVWMLPAFSQGSDALES